MAKLVLSDSEIALIKSFTDADGYNDQVPWGAASAVLYIDRRQSGLGYAMHQT